MMFSYENGLKFILGILLVGYLCLRLYRIHKRRKLINDIKDILKKPF